MEILPHQLGKHLNKIISIYLRKKEINKMDNIYSLRTNFAIVGLTGRSGSGCSEIAERLSDATYISRIEYSDELKNDKSVDKLKLDICLKYLRHDDNWKPFQLIKYSSVLIYHLLHESCLENNFEESKTRLIENIINSCGENGKYRYSPDDKVVVSNVINQIFDKKVHNIFRAHDCEVLEYCLSTKKPENIVKYFWDVISPFSDKLIGKLKEYDYPKSALLIQNLACNLRSYGSVCANGDPDINNSYTVAETINRIIKAYRKHQDEYSNDLGHGRIVIDSLKNSIELLYFKEKYSAFYCLATNKIEKEATEYKENIFRKKFGENAAKWLDANIQIDNFEYKGGKVNSGIFSSPDVENCIQKSDYHIFWSKDFEKYQDYLLGETSSSTNLDRQLIKFISLLFVPGIITPSSIERNMQIAFNAKVNSGCISRQVGAVITDEHYSVKAIGWNDVARYQIPCNLRSIDELISGENDHHYSDFEKGLAGRYSDGKSFFEKMTNIKTSVDESNLKGRNCSFCFKSCHNAFEGKENQVHTRSLHAEENAMLQITKYGGQGVKNGFLFTTASPCELCSKKAFQLGIKEIYYIDPYPGIAVSHILKSAHEVNKNPLVKMFRGAVGRAFHKLYEPFMNYKDEIKIRTKFSPEIDPKYYLDKLTKDEGKQAKIKAILEE